MMPSIEPQGNVWHRLPEASAAGLFDNIPHWHEQPLALGTSAGAFSNMTSAAFDRTASFADKWIEHGDASLGLTPWPSFPPTQSLIPSPFSDDSIAQRPHYAMQQRSNQVALPTQATQGWQYLGDGQLMDIDWSCEPGSSNTYLSEAIEVPDEWFSSEAVHAASNSQDLGSGFPPTADTSNSASHVTIAPKTQQAKAKSDIQQAAKTRPSTTGRISKSSRRAAPHSNFRGYLEFEIELPSQTKPTNIRRGKALSEQELACRKRGACLWCKYHQQKVSKPCLSS